MVQVNDPHTLGKVYDLLRNCGFPDVPEWVSAYLHLTQCRSFVDAKDRVGVWVGYHSFDADSCHVDLCVKPEKQGKWLTKGLFKEIMARPRTWGCKKIYALAGNSKQQDRLLKVGFTRVDNEPSMLVFTYQDYFKRSVALNG